MRNNPFTPSFGKVPPHLAGRDDVLEDMRNAFENGPGDPNLSTLLIGARGSGKTALLSCIAEDALSLGWISANVSAGMIVIAGRPISGSHSSVKSTHFSMKSAAKRLSAVGQVAKRASTSVTGTPWQ